MLPNCMPLLWFWSDDGGRPPLAGGCGMGEGEWVGVVVRGFACGVASEDV